MLVLQSLQVLATWLTGIIAGVLCGAWWGQILSSGDRDATFFTTLSTRTSSEPTENSMPMLMALAVLGVAAWLGITLSLCRRGPLSGAADSRPGAPGLCRADHAGGQRPHQPARCVSPPGTASRPHPTGKGSKKFVPVGTRPTSAAPSRPLWLAFLCPAAVPGILSCCSRRPHSLFC